MPSWLGWGWQNPAEAYPLRLRRQCCCRNRCGFHSFGRCLQPCDGAVAPLAPVRRRGIGPSPRRTPTTAGAPSSARAVSRFSRAACNRRPSERANEADGTALAGAHEKSPASKEDQGPARERLHYGSKDQSAAAWLRRDESDFQRVTPGSCETDTYPGTFPPRRHPTHMLRPS